MSKVSVHQRKARDFIQREDWANALAELHRLVAADSSNPTLHNQIGDIYLRKEDVTRACEHFEQAVDHYAAVGLHNNALALCKKVMRLRPGRFEMRYRLARLRLDQGFRGEAATFFRDYLDHVPCEPSHADAIESHCREMMELLPDEAPLSKMLEMLEGVKRYVAAFEIVRKQAQRATDAGDDGAAKRLNEKMRSLRLLVERGGGRDLISELTQNEAPGARPAAAAPGQAPAPVSQPEAAVARSAAAEIDPSMRTLEDEAPLDIVRTSDPMIRSPEALEPPATPTADIGSLWNDQLAPEALEPAPALPPAPAPAPPKSAEIVTPAPAAALRPAEPLDANPIERLWSEPSPARHRSRAPVPAAETEDLSGPTAFADLAHELGDVSTTRPAEEEALVEELSEWSPPGAGWTETDADVASLQPEAIEPLGPTSRHDGYPNAGAAMRFDGGAATDFGHEGHFAAGTAGQGVGSGVTPPDPGISGWVDALRRQPVWIPSDAGDATATDPWKHGASMELESVIDSFREQMARALDGDGAARYDLGVAYFDMGLYNEALAEFEAAARCPGLEVQSYEMLAACLLQTGRHVEVVELLLPVLADEGHSPRGRLGLQYSLGLAYEALGDWEHARHCFEEVAHVDMDFKDVQVRLQRT